MSESDAAVAKLSIPEVNLLLLLDTASVTLTRPDGAVRWALDTEDVCDLLELAVELVAEWGPTGIGVRQRAASLLSLIACREPRTVGGLG